MYADAAAADCCVHARARSGSEPPRRGATRRHRSVIPRARTHTRLPRGPCRRGGFSTFSWRGAMEPRLAGRPACAYGAPARPRAPPLPVAAAARAPVIPPAAVRTSCAAHMRSRRGRGGVRPPSPSRASRELRAGGARIPHWSPRPPVTRQSLRSARPTSPFFRCLPGPRRGCSRKRGSFLTLPRAFGFASNRERMRLL